MWWLPGSRDHAVQGTLSSEGGEEMILAVTNFLNPNTGSFPSEYPIILGSSHSGQIITLNNCVQRRRQLSLSGFPQVRYDEYRVQRAFFDAHIPSADAVRFYRIDIRYSHLPDWAQMSGFDEKMTYASETTPGRYELVYMEPDPVRLETKRGVVSISAMFNSSRDLLRDVLLRQSVWFNIEVAEELLFDEWLALFLHPLQNFLTLATGRPNSLVHIMGYSRQPEVTHWIFDSRFFGKDKSAYPVPISFITNAGKDDEGKTLPREEILFTLPDLGEQAGNCLDRWFSVSEELDSVCGLYFHVMFNDSMSIEQQFWNLTQAAESYHRRRRSNQALPQEQHQQRLEAVLASAPEEHRNWLTYQLKWSNEPHLEERLKDLLIDIADIVAPLIGKPKAKRNEFVGTVTATRHYLTHWDPSRKDQATTGKELEQIVRVLKIVVQACFLRELGLSQQRVLALFERNGAYSFARNKGSNI